ncbi:hypothetical protein [Demequina salsinemoris]|uniref:hypothetical protein n=1 Tax=Demequina salsinemoris TaxID=577470 RepID=UPI000783D30C|nr:hypothetical protein [Demequina salsinemoris]
MQIAGDASSLDLWRRAVLDNADDASLKLGLARALVSHSIRATCSGGDGAELLAECAFTLCAIDDLEALTDPEALLFAGTAAGCASGLVTAGRPRLALGVLAPAAHVLDSRPALAGTATPQAKPQLPGTAAEDGSEAKGRALAASARRSEASRRFQSFTPYSPEDVAPGTVFTTPWPLPPVSWHYLRASVGVAMGCGLAAVGETDKAIAEHSEAMLTCFAGAPYDYARTVSLSATIGRRLEQLLETSEPHGRAANR